MSRNITKVKTHVKEKMNAGKTGWLAVLADLNKLVSIVERKIERREPWPTQSEIQHEGQQHSV